MCCGQGDFHEAGVVVGIPLIFRVGVPTYIIPVAEIGFIEGLVVMNIKLLEVVNRMGYVICPVIIPIDGTISEDGIAKEPLNPLAGAVTIGIRVDAVVGTGDAFQHDQRVGIGSGRFLNVELSDLLGIVRMNGIQCALKVILTGPPGGGAMGLFYPEPES